MPAVRNRVEAGASRPRASGPDVGIVGIDGIGGTGPGHAGHCRPVGESLLRNPSPAKPFAVSAILGGDSVLHYTSTFCAVAMLPCCAAAP